MGQPIRDDGDLELPVSPALVPTEEGPNDSSTTLSAGPTIWRPGDLISGLYEVKQVHTGGAMGLVYRVRHRGWGIDLAMKSPRIGLIDDERKKVLFEREANTWIRLGLHPHVVSCYYVRRLNGVPTIFAEYVAGGSLEDWIRSRRLYAGGPVAALARMLDLAIQFAWGLRHAHAHGLVHQDVKPANALLTLGGTLKVTDFGLARTWGGAPPRVPTDGAAPPSPLVTYGGMTPAFCSPEQARRESLSAKSDMWSWGVCLLEMFLGEVTWTSGNAAAEVLENYDELFAAGGEVPRLPGDLADLLERIFRKDPAGRPADMGAVADELIDLYPRAARTAYARTAPPPAEVMPDALNNRAASLIDLGKPDEAVGCWRHALDKEAFHPESSFNLGLHRWRAGEVGQRELAERLRQVAGAHAGEWRPLYMLAYAQLELDDPDAARATFNRLGADDLERPEVLDLRNRIEQHQANDRAPAATLHGHSTAVRCVALSPEGALAATGSWDETVKLWDLAGGRALYTFTGHHDVVTAVAFRGGQPQVASASADGTVRLWDGAAGGCLWTSRHRGQEVLALAATGDGRTLFSAGRDGVIRRWKARTGEPAGTWEGHRGVITALAISPDQGTLASGSKTPPLSKSRDDGVRLWDVRSERSYARWPCDSGVACLAFSPDGANLVTGSLDGKVRIWDVATGRVETEFDPRAGRINSVAYLTGKLILSGTEEGLMHVWDAARGRPVRELHGHPGPVHVVCPHPDGEQVLTGSSDGTVRCWRPYAARAPLFLSRVVDGERASQGRQEFRRCLREATSAVDAGEPVDAARALREARTQPGYARHPAALALWSELYLRLGRRTLNGAWEERTLTGHEAAVSSIDCSADGTWLASGCRDGSVGLWTVDGGGQAASFRGHRAAVQAVRLCGPEGRLVLSGGDDRTVRLWDRETGRCRRVMRGHRGPVRALAVTADGRFGLSASLDGTVKFWLLPAGRCVRTLRAHAGGVVSVCLSGDERQLLTSGQDRTLAFWDFSTGERVRVCNGGNCRLRSVALAADGSVALAGTSAALFTCWDPRSGKCTAVVEGHDGRVPAVALSPDGRFAATGSSDRSIKVWRLRGGRCMQTLEGHRGPVTAVRFSPDMRYAFSASEDGTVRVWTLDWELENNESCDWHEAAEPYLRAFLLRRVPFGPAPPRFLPARWFVRRVLQRVGEPVWSQDDFEQLLAGLQSAGLGWVNAAGVERRLGELAAEQTRGRESASDL